MGCSCQLLMGARPSCGASNVRDACNQQTEAGHQRRIMKGNWQLKEYTAERFIILLRKWLTVTGTKPAREGPTPCPSNTRGGPRTVLLHWLLVGLFNDAVSTEHVIECRIALWLCLVKVSYFVSTATDGFRWNLVLRWFTNFVLWI
jgi:hypothetical protein